jgi:coenzyme Q-binding protein COQ10
MPTHHERRHLPYTPEQLFDLVADVERYPEFLPWVLAAHIRRREGDAVWVDLTVGTRIVRRTFTSEASLRRPNRIVIASHDAMFDHYQQVWSFEPAEDGGTIVEFRVDFGFRSSLMQTLMGRFLEGIAADMVSAFKHRARQFHGAGGTARNAG